MKYARQFEVRNAGGGILLLGIPEQRGEDDQPTGVPDAAGVLGLEVGNPQAVLTAYDARVMEAIEERLPIEFFCIDMGGGRWVLAIRVPNSTNKPHSVRHQGHCLPAQNERRRANQIWQRTPSVYTMLSCAVTSA